MKLSSGARRFEALSVAQHGEQDSHPSLGQGDHGVVVPPALTPLALLEGAGVRSAQAGEGGLVEDSLEHLVTSAHAAMVAHPLAGVSSHGHQTGVGDEVAGRGECGRVSCGHQKLGAEARAHAGQAGEDLGERMGEEEHFESLIKGIEALA